MNGKRMIICFCGMLAFFGGAVWTDYIPTAGSWVALIEVLLGFLCGYLFYRDVAKEKAVSYQETIQKLLDTNLQLSQENALLKKDVEKPMKARKPRKKVEEEPKGE